MITVQCVECGFNNKLVFNQKMVGKKVKYSCKNPSCGTANFYTFPKEQSSNSPQETIVSNYNPSSFTNGMITWHDLKGKEDVSFNIVNGVNIIGRESSQKSPDIAIPTEDKTMSRLHCVIVCIKGGRGMNYLLKEYSNKNPLILNGKTLESGTEVYLENGDQIHLGRTIVSFNLI